VPVHQVPPEAGLPHSLYGSHIARAPRLCAAGVAANR
jgi:hypothetical protein